MVASQNGWRANDRSVIVSINVPGGKLPVRAGDIATIFENLATRFHIEVEGLIWPGCWGYAERPIRGGTALSNHASGTAIDLNAPKHGLGTLPSSNFTPAQIAKIREIVNFYEGIIRWGGDYVGRKDGMHFEINDGITEAQVARIAAKIKAPVVVTPTAPPSPPVSSGRPTIKRGSTGTAVWDLQRVLTRNYPLYNRYKPTGLFGSLTESGVREFQRRTGLTVDGIVGPKTWTRLGL